MRPGSIHRVWPLLFVAGSGLLVAQGDRELSASPDFSQEPIRASAAEVVDAWNKWLRRGRGLEDRAFRLPMAEVRELVQAAFGDYLDFLNKRRAYGQAVASYIERLRATPKPGEPVVSAPGVYQDQILIFAANLSSLQTKLDDLRHSPQWVAIRRGVQADRDAILKIEGSLRSQTIPQDLAIGSSHAPALMSSIAYRDSERQLAEILQQLWTHYYQALIDGVEQRPGGSMPLITARSSGGPAAPAASPGAPPGQNPLLGVWEYVDGSQQFNGVAEPHRVLLELWIENGSLAGRYRAELPDFSGERKIDLRLHAPAGANSAPLTLQFESTDPPSKGEIILEGPLEGATQLMLVRNVGAQGPIPRGRELLHRR